MKPPFAFGAALAVLLMPGAASATLTPYNVTLVGGQEVPPVTTSATAIAEIAFDDLNGMGPGGGGFLRGKITLIGLTSADVTKAECSPS